VPVAIVPVITRGWIDIPGAPVAARAARNRIFLGVSWKAVIRGLMIARQEAVAMPAWRRPVMSGRRLSDDRQQRQDDSNRQKHQARHNDTIDGWRSGGDSNLSAQSSATASGSLAKPPLCAPPPQADVRGVGEPTFQRETQTNDAPSRRPYAAISLPAARRVASYAASAVARSSA
jgi:hypothetical protein